MAKHTTALSKPNAAPTRYAPVERMAPAKEKKDRAEILRNHTPTTGIIAKVLKYKDERKVWIESITQAMAIDLLTLNHVRKNRDVDEKNVTYCSEEMKDANWMFTGDAVRVTTNGNLIDGQHRLWAIWESGVTQQVVIVTGLEEKVFTLIDIGKKRSARDVVSIRDYKGNSVALAYAIKNILLFEKSRRMGSAVNSTKISNREVDKFAEDQKRMDLLNGMVELAKAQWIEQRKAYFTAGQWAAIHYILHNLPGCAHKANEFLKGFTYGENLSGTNPIFHLKKVFDNMEYMPRGKERNTTKGDVFTIKVKFVFEAWNQWITNTKVSELKIDTKDIRIEMPRHK